MIGPDELHDLLHAHAATIEPIPHLAELGAGLTSVERHRRTRVVVGTTIAAVAVAAAVTTMRAIDTRSSRFDTAPATQRIVVAPDPRTALATTIPAVAGDTAPTTTPTTAPAAGASAAASGQPVTPAPTGTAVAAPPAPAASPPPSNPAPSNPGGHTGGTRILTFRAASVSDLSPANPPAVDYFGVAPPGSTVTATSTYGSASTQAGPDGKWTIHLVLPNAPVGQRVRVVLSAPPLPALTFNFTHTAG